MPAPSLVSNGTTNAYSYLQSTLTGGWGWAPLAPDAYATVNDQKEKTFGGYGLLRFGSDSSAIGRFDGNIGVRVVNTKNDAGPIGLTVPTLANAPTVAACQASATAAGVAATICDPLAQLYTFLGGSTVTVDGLPSTKSSYTDVLPSLNLRFFLQDNMFLRFAAAKAMIRPTFQQMLPVINLSATFQTGGTQAGFPGPSCTLTPPTFVCPGPFRGFAGNPALRPTQSNQLDASWEYYFGNAGQLSAAVFTRTSRTTSSRA